MSHRKKLLKLFEQTSTHLVEWQIDHTNNHTNIIKDFMSFCKHKLNIKNMPKVIVVAHKQADMSTGCYLPHLNITKVLGGKRALLDIMRSLAHEFVHRQQDEQGKLKDIGPQGNRDENDKSDIGVWFEDEANAKGGALIKEYSRTSKYKDILYEL